MRLFANVLSAALLLTIAPSVLADSFQYTINSSVQEFISNTSNENFMGIYSTPPDAWGTTEEVHTQDHYPQNSAVSNISFSVPTGNVITSAELELILPSTVATGPAESFAVTTFAISPPDTDNPVHIGPTVDSGTVSVDVDGIVINGRTPSARAEGDSLVFDLSNFLTIDGSNGFSSNLQELQFLGLGEINIQVSSGYNWGGYIGGSGQVNLPYTLEVVGTYSPAPEPSSIALLGTGILGLAGIARRKHSSNRRKRIAAVGWRAK